VAAFVDSAENPRMLGNERVSPVQLLSDHVGKASILGVVRGKGLSVPAIPRIALALHNRPNLLLIRGATRLSQRRNGRGQDNRKK
jgi:hypothetical protein